MKIADLCGELKKLANAYADSGAKAKTNTLMEAHDVLLEASALTVQEHIAGLQPKKPKAAAKSRKVAFDANHYASLLKEAGTNRARFDQIIAEIELRKAAAPDLKLLMKSYGATLSGKDSKPNLYKALEDRFRIKQQSESNKGFLETITPW
ncbi:MAG: hypothetical protein SGJ17_00905 [Hyphomicrobiales bacterium]|nr:hypothetical protein [Hyphomicrobiales bacterium]